MRKRSRILSAVLAAATLGGLAWWALHPREPVYQGKTLSRWLDEYNRVGAWNKTKPVSDAIRAMGTNSLPFLLAHITRTESPLKTVFFNFVERQHWTKLPFYGTDPFHSTSILALSALGSNAAPLCPELLKVAESSNTPWQEMKSLLAIGPASIPTLAKACQSTNVVVRADAASIIAMLKARPAPWFSSVWYNDLVSGRPVFGLVASLRDEDIQELLKLLENPDAAVRRASADEIWRYGVLAKAAIGPLTRALNDPDPAVRLSAAQALKYISPQTATQAGVK